MKSLTMRWALLLSLASVPAGTLRAQSGSGDGPGGNTEIVRGHVRTMGRQPVRSAEVTVTGLMSRAVRTTRTNDKGLYTVLFADGDGEYVIRVRALGYAPVLARALRVRDETVLIADIEVGRPPGLLDSVIIRAQAMLDDTLFLRGGRDLLQGALFTLDPSDLRALAAMVPGVLLIPGVNGRPDSLSVLGAAADQNIITVDGATMSGSALPPDAVSKATVITTTSDPGRGNFSGAEIAMRTRGGAERHAVNVRGNFADPRLAWADPAAPTTIAQSLSVSGSAGGPIQRGRSHYMLSFSDNQRASDLVSLLTLNDARRAQVGLHRDTVAALTGQLLELGLPVRLSGVPDRMLTSNRSSVLRLDMAPRATLSVALNIMGGWMTQSGSGVSPTAYPSLGSRGRNTNYGFQFTASSYARGFTHQLRTGVQGSTNSTDPYFRLPVGTVRVGTELVSGGGGLTSLSFGGGQSGSGSSKTRSWETWNELAWLTNNSRRRVSFGQSVTLGWNASNSSPNPFGQFSYQSLADLSANQPASYSRTLSGTSRRAQAASGALWTGAQLRSSHDRLRAELGLRLDVARSTTTPRYNPAIDSMYGARTDVVPHDLGLSPRASINWTIRPSSSTRQPSSLNPRLPFGGYTEALALGLTLGAFHGVLQPSRIASMVDQTGLANSVRQLTCVGVATPIPDWTRYQSAVEAVPAECLDGTGAVEFAANRSSVAMFSPSFRAPTSWRMETQLTGLRLRRWPVTVRGTYSLGVNGESAIDLNLVRTAGFRLASEGGRPIFVLPERIVASTGAIAPGASRVSERFGTVQSYVSDLRTRAAQLAVSITSPRQLFGRVPLEFQYMASRTRSEERGFNGSTAGDPFVREWAQAAQPTHQFIVGSYVKLRWIMLSVRTSLASGRPYTPLVNGDVNGDGRSNDRAFIFDPAMVDDPVLASQMTGLLNALPARTRSCLTAQMGHIATRNSCRTGWWLQPDLNIGFDFPTLPFQQKQFSTLGDHLNFSFTTSNALGAVLRLLGLQNTPLAMASSANFAVDPTLLYVQGFDPVTRQFRYQVNQQFGDRRIRSKSVARYRNGYSGAFQMMLSGEIRIGGPPRRTMAQGLGLVGTERHAKPVSEADAAQQLRALTSNPVRPLLALKDSLLLTEVQLKRLGTINTQLVSRSDSLLAPLARYIAERSQAGKAIKDDDLQRRISKVMPKMLQQMLEAAREASGVLTTEQRAKAPPTFRM